ncbi:MAG: oxidoreductase [Sphingobacteriales bacterium]|nr:oxidoreductase [Sphingobacteriales bacterium]
MNTTINTGLLAFGMSGQVFHAPFIHAHPAFKLCAITERSKKQAHQYYPEIKSCDSVDEVINDPNIELIIVNTPNNTHCEYAVKALKAGKHVLVEKPCTSSLKETQELFQIAQENNREVFVYQNRRWDSDFQSVKDILVSGVLGKIVEVNIRFERYKTAIGPKVFKETPLPGSGLLFDLGPHLIDQVISVFGRPTNCYKSTACNREGSQVVDYAFLQLSYPENLKVNIHTSLLVAQPLPAFVVHGTNGSFIKERMDVQEAQLLAHMSPLDSEYGLEPEGQEGKLTLVSKDGIKTSEAVPSKRGEYMQIFEAVFQTLRNEKPFPISQEQILWQMELLEQ